MAWIVFLRMIGVSFEFEWCYWFGVLVMTQEVLPLPDQVDEAINYIKSLEAKVKMAQEKKESLQGIKKRSHGCFSSSRATFAATRLPKSPQLEIQEVGSSLQVVLITGIDHQFIFCEIIRMLHEENIEVRSANSSLTGDSVLHVVHAEVCVIIFCCLICSS